MISKDLKIFLSSTYIDLRDVREKILKFLSVLKSDLINMEAFGSDESKSKEYCLEKVNNCNFFIGVYAERYGDIDKETNLSLTELEYHKAYEKLQRNEIIGMLLYCIDKNANWQISNIDRDPKKVKKLLSFKSLIASRHTLTFFIDVDELPFNILRDTIRKLELGTQNFFQLKDFKYIEPKTRLEKPIGMEFFNQDLSNFFWGREKEIEKLNAQIINFNFSLLIGISGIGKTSLVNAGILPIFKNLNWITISIRPLNDPKRNLKTFLWNQLFQGTVPVELEFIDVIRLALNINSTRKLLIIIDQFEDILNSKANDDVDYVIFQLTQIFLLKHSNLHLLISYRGDVESEIGFIWQNISGAPDGLPRFYLNPLPNKAALEIFNQTFLNLSISCDTDLIEKIIQDIYIESQSNGHKGIFPPFLQMVISSLYEHLKSDQKLSLKLYSQLGESRQIIAGFLVDQLMYLGAEKANGIKILICLVSNYGSKTQKNLEEIQKETEISIKVVVPILLKLMDLRLIRSIENDYEVTHDLLAKSILQSLITDEELNVRRFQFLLQSKAAAYENTKSSFSILEHLLIYKYRSRIQGNIQEIQFLITSFVLNKIPIYYWLNYELIIKINQEEISSIFEIVEKDLELLNQAIKKDYKSPVIESYSELELANYSKGNSESTIKKFYDYAVSYSQNLRLKTGLNFLSDKPKWKNLLGLVIIGHKGSVKHLSLLKDILDSKKSSKKMRAIAFTAILKIGLRTKKYKILNKMISDYKGPYFDFIFNEQEGLNDFQIYSKNLLDLSIKRNDSSHIRFILRAIEVSSTSSNIGNIQKIFGDRNTLSFLSSYGLIPAIVNILVKCSTSNEYSYIIDFIRNSEISLRIYYKFLLHEQIAKLVTEDNYEFLLEIVTKELSTLGESSYSGELFNFLRFENNENRYFFTWVVFTSFFNIIKQEDKFLAFKALQHFFYTVRLSAVRAIYKLGEVSDIEPLINLAIINSRNKSSELINTALRSLDLKFYLKEDVLKYLRENRISRQKKMYGEVNFYPKNEFHLATDDLPF